MSIPEDRLALAEHYLEIAQPQRALDVLGRGDGLLEDGHYWALRCAALIDLDRDRDAVSAAEAGLQLDPEDTILLRLHARAAGNTGDLALAERSLLSALAQDSDQPQLLAEYAILLARGGQVDKASRVLDEAERLDPLDGRVVSARGIIAYLRGDDSTTKKRAEQLLAHDPEARPGHLLRGAVLSSRGSARAARRHYEAAARLDPTDARVVEAAHAARRVAHPVLWPIYPVIRFGPMRTWLGFIVIAGIAFATHITPLITVVIVGYLFMVVYSWTIAPLFVRHMRRRRG
ncbi:MAG TPA: tetratricopeptide repeat protein [Gaiellaceae bacterium]